MMGIFGRDKKVDTKEAVRELQRKMRTELRHLDRQIHAIEREEMKVALLIERYKNFYQITFEHRSI